MLQSSTPGTALVAADASTTSPPAPPDAKQGVASLAARLPMGVRRRKRRRGESPDLDAHLGSRKSEKGKWEELTLPLSCFVYGVDKDLYLFLSFVFLFSSAKLTLLLRV
jgi:hypothetical protein